MSSGILDQMARAQRADQPGDHVKWFTSGGKGPQEPARDGASAFCHDQVELPSRRWYVEAMAEGAGE